MKLSDKDLHYALWCAEKHTGNSLYDEAMADLDDGVLEIEGYSQDKWIKFDSDNPKTFPEHGSLVLMCRKDGVVCFGHFFDGDEKRLYWGHEVTHWQPLPKPPVETEVQQ